MLLAEDDSSLFVLVLCTDSLERVSSAVLLISDSPDEVSISASLLGAVISSSNVPASGFTYSSVS